MTDLFLIPYDKFVATLAKPGGKITLTMTPSKAFLWHAGTGISTEAGELLEGVQTYLMFDSSRADEEIYPDPVSTQEVIMTNLVEELGDLLFYAQMVRNNVIDANTLTGEAADIIGTRFTVGDLPPFDEDEDFNNSLLYSAIDLSIASAIILGFVKQFVIYNKPVPYTEIINALNDVEEIVSYIANLIDVPIDTILHQNKVKLNDRYESLAYSDDAANARADKAA